MKKMIRLTMKVNTDSDGLPKFSFDISMMAAAANSPTITRRSVPKMSVTAFDWLCLKRNRLMLTIKMNGSQITLKEAKMAPRTAAHVGKPA